MAEIKKRILKLSPGKQVPLYGNSISIGESLEGGEGNIPNMLALPLEPGSEQKIQNPQHLTRDEMLELVDFMTGLWLQLKENIRRYGLEDPKIFQGESGR
ncbi:MAG TPA: hypothetical protein VL053_14525 [Arachidicoccus sp.]|nr:hypothetical protein [Arachidicoccus sp.]